MRRKIQLWEFRLKTFSYAKRFYSPRKRQEKFSICNIAFFILLATNIALTIRFSQMPKVKTSKTKFPEGWELIAPTLDEFQQKMRDGLYFIVLICTVFILFIAAENDPHEGKRKAESVWPIMRLHHQRSRYIYELFYKKKQISRELYEFCLNEGYADKNLIAKWKKVRIYSAHTACDTAHTTHTHCIRCIVTTQTTSTQQFSNCILCSLVMRNCVVCDVYNLKITILLPLVFVEYLKTNSKKVCYSPMLTEPVAVVTVLCGCFFLYLSPLFVCIV